MAKTTFMPRYVGGNTPCIGMTTDGRYALSMTCDIKAKPGTELPSVTPKEDVPEDAESAAVASGYGRLMIMSARSVLLMAGVAAETIKSTPDAAPFAGAVDVNPELVYDPKMWAAPGAGKTADDFITRVASASRYKRLASAADKRIPFTASKASSADLLDKYIEEHPDGINGVSELAMGDFYAGAAPWLTSPKGGLSYLATRVDSGHALNMAKAMETMPGYEFWGYCRSNRSMLGFAWMGGCLPVDWQSAARYCTFAAYPLVTTFAGIEPKSNGGVTTAFPSYLAWYQLNTKTGGVSTFPDVKKPGDPPLSFPIELYNDLCSMLWSDIGPAMAGMWSSWALTTMAHHLGTITSARTGRRVAHFVGTVAGFSKKESGGKVIGPHLLPGSTELGMLGLTQTWWLSITSDIAWPHVFALSPGCSMVAFAIKYIRENGDIEVLASQHAGTKNPEGAAAKVEAAKNSIAVAEAGSYETPWAKLVAG
jgi:hypothetical protein